MVLLIVLFFKVFGATDSTKESTLAVFSINRGLDQMKEPLIIFNETLTP